MCFQDDPSAEMTQIDLWKSYQGTFLPFAATHPHLIAGDFIKNVSNTFTGASAQVAGQNKYVIRGIKPRLTPVDYRGRELVRCQWRLESNGTKSEAASVFAHADGTECGQYYPHSPSLFEHILSNHLQVHRKRPTPAEASDKNATNSLGSSFRLFDFSAGEASSQVSCAWSSCHHNTANEIVSKDWVKRALLARHIQTHLPDNNGSRSSSVKRSNKDSDSSKSGSSMQTWKYYNTISDERNDAAGVPLGACLVMRNIARGIAKMGPESEAQKEVLEKVKTQAEVEAIGFEAPAKKPDAGEIAKAAPSAKALLMRLLFDPVKDQMFYALAHNRPLKDYVGAVLRIINSAGG